MKSGEFKGIGEPTGEISEAVLKKIYTVMRQQRDYKTGYSDQELFQFLTNALNLLEVTMPDLLSGRIATIKAELHYANSMRLIHGDGPLPSAAPDSNLGDRWLAAELLDKIYQGYVAHDTDQLALGSLVAQAKDSRKK